MSPSVIKSGDGTVNEIWGEFSRAGRDMIGARSMRCPPVRNEGRDGVSPSRIWSGVGCVNEMRGEFSRDGRDMIGARSMQALPCETRGGMACRRP